MALEDIFYVRTALGKHKNPIRVYKLRTLRKNSQPDEEFSGELDQFGKPKHEHRLTRVGKFLRTYWIDEIPQFYNLLRGDLTLVGIRPRPEEAWARYPKEHMEHALKYKPGLFSPVYSNRNLREFKDLIETEREYLRQKDARPILTDVKYFFLILYSIVFKGMRSK